MIALRAPDDAALVYMATRLRAVERDELRFMLGLDAVDGLRYCARTATDAVVVTYNDEPVALYGYATVSVVTATIAPFLILTERGASLTHALGRCSLRYINSLDAFNCVNFAFADNVVTLRWLERLGFTLHAPAAMGGMRLVRFTRPRKEADDVRRHDPDRSDAGVDRSQRVLGLPSIQLPSRARRA